MRDEDGDEDNNDVNSADDMHTYAHMQRRAQAFTDMHIYAHT